MLVDPGRAAAGARSRGWRLATVSRIASESIVLRCVVDNDAELVTCLK
jgi:hypothetical protein